MKRLPFLTIFLFIVLVDSGKTQTWPQWRGPARDGSVENFDSPSKWPDALKQIWRVKAGAGLSSPVLGKERAFLLTREDENEIVTCYALNDGEVLWRKQYSSRFYPNSQAIRPRLFPASKGKGPFATPVIHENRLYSLGVDRVLTCFDANTGDILWQQHYFKQTLPEEIIYVCPPCGCDQDNKTFAAAGTCTSCNMPFNVQAIETTSKRGGNYYGAVSSPIVAGNQGIVHVGNSEHSVMIAFDLKTGEEKWQWKGPGVASSSPVYGVFQGVEQLVNLTRESVVGVSLQDGSLLWSFPLQSNAQIVTPVIYENLVIFSAYRGPVTAIKVGRNSKKWTVAEAWKNGDFTLEMSSPIISNNQVIGLFYTKKGQFASLDVKTGKTTWASEGRMGRGAALVNLEQEILALKDDGTIVIFKVNDSRFSVVKEYQGADTPAWAYPAVFENKILIKDEENLTLWGFE